MNKLFATLLAAAFAAATVTPVIAQDKKAADAPKAEAKKDAKAADAPKADAKKDAKAADAPKGDMKKDEKAKK